MRYVGEISNTWLCCLFLDYVGLADLADVSHADASMTTQTRGCDGQCKRPRPAASRTPKAELQPRRARIAGVTVPQNWRRSAHPTRASPRRDERALGAIRGSHPGFGRQECVGADRDWCARQPARPMTSPLRQAVIGDPLVDAMDAPGLAHEPRPPAAPPLRRIGLSPSSDGPPRRSSPRASRLTSVGRTDGFEAQAMRSTRERRSLVGRSGHHAPPDSQGGCHGAPDMRANVNGGLRRLGEPGCDLVETKVQASAGSSTGRDSLAPFLVSSPAGPPVQAPSCPWSTTRRMAPGKTVPITRGRTDWISSGAVFRPRSDLRGGAAASASLECLPYVGAPAVS